VRVLHCCPAFADFELVVLAAMGTANVERDEAQSAITRLVGFGAFDSGVDLLPSGWTRECKRAHDKTLSELPRH
jgi:hypothetical protein